MGLNSQYNIHAAAKNYRLQQDLYMLLGGKATVVG
jgi:hypothetical protein